MINKKLLLLVAALMTLQACSLPFDLSSTSKTYYVLRDTQRAEKTFSQRPSRMLVREMLASGFIESHRIVFTRGDGTRGFYQFASWTEVPSKQIANQLLRKLRDSKMFLSSSRAESGAVADLQLNTELNEFVHNLSKDGGVVQVMVSAELIDLRTRYVLGSVHFSDERKVSSNDAEGAAAAFSESVSTLTSQIVDWLDQTLPPGAGNEKAAM